MRPHPYARVWLILAALTFGAPASADAPVLCSHDTGLCLKYRALENRLNALMPGRVKKTGNFSYPEKRLATAEQLNEVNAKYLAIDDGIENLVFSLKKKKDAAPDLQKIGAERGALRHRVNVLSLGVIPMNLDALSKLLGEVEALAAELALDVEAAGKEISPETLAGFSERFYTLNAVGTRLWEHINTESMNIGRMLGTQYRIDYPDGRKVDTGAVTFTKGINPLQERVAALAERLQALNRRLGFEAGKSPEEVKAEIKAIETQLSQKGLLIDPFTKRPIAPKSEGAGRSGGASADTAVRMAVVLTEKRPTLLDMPRAKIPDPEVETLRDSPGLIKNLIAAMMGTGKSQTRDSKEAQRVMQMRAKGETEIIGDPMRRAKFVYSQEGGTCGIGAQIQVLQEIGRVPVGQGRKAEDELYQRATRERLIEGAKADKMRRETTGTPVVYIGDLLDMPVKKHFGATDEELVRVLKTGKMVLASFESGTLWNNPKFANMGHAVAVTGIELDPKTDTALGFYINDTGTNQGGRFIPAKQFLDAWHKRSRMFVEPL